MYNLIDDHNFLLSVFLIHYACSFFHINLWKALALKLIYSITTVKQRHIVVYMWEKCFFYINVQCNFFENNFTKMLLKYFWKYCREFECKHNFFLFKLVILSRCHKIYDCDDQSFIYFISILQSQEWRHSPYSETYIGVFDHTVLRSMIGPLKLLNFFICWLWILSLL